MHASVVERYQEIPREHISPRVGNLDALIRVEDRDQWIKAPEGGEVLRGQYRATEVNGDDGEAKCGDTRDRRRPNA